MKTNKTVFLLVGQRGSGKSHYSKRLIEAHPDLQLVSRDEILIRMFGSVHSDPYSGISHFAHEVIFRLLRRKFTKHDDLKLVLDYWTGYSEERQKLIKKLRDCGATRVVALYFITTLAMVQKWFWQKPGIAKFGAKEKKEQKNVAYFSEDAPNHDYKLFHNFALSIDHDGFDEVIRIDPLKDLIDLKI